MAATQKTASRNTASKKPDKDDSCQRVMCDYFDLTGDTLEKQVELFRKISKKIAEGKYTSEEAQEDWRLSVHRAADYSQGVTKLWVEGMTRCSWTAFWPGVNDFFGSDASSRSS